MLVHYTSYKTSNSALFDAIIHLSYTQADTTLTLLKRLRVLFSQSQLAGLSEQTQTQQAAIVASTHLLVRRLVQLKRHNNFYEMGETGMGDMWLRGVMWQ